MSIPPSFSILVLSLSAYTAVKEGTEAVENLTQRSYSYPHPSHRNQGQIQTTVDTVNNLKDQISKVASNGLP